jgi:hypothetical protein
MKIFWSWQSDTPGKTGRYLVRDALQDAIDKLKQTLDIEEPVRETVHLDQDIQGTTGSPDLARTIFDKIEKSEVVVADVTLVGATGSQKKLTNSNVAIELGYALHAVTDHNVLLVFNRHYGTHEDLPFDLRHKGGAIVFNLAPDAGREVIDVQRTNLIGRFTDSLRPFLELKQRPPRKQPLSLKANLKHQRVAVPGGGDDERYLLLASVENDGEQDATDFRLDVEIPAFFLDEGGHRLRVEDARPGFPRFQITNKDEACRIEHFYPGDKTKDLIAFHYAVRGQTKRQDPELLEQEVTATVFSGSMTPKKTVMTIAELMD